MPSVRFCTLKWEKRTHAVSSFLSFKCPSEYEYAFVTCLCRFVPIVEDPLYLLVDIARALCGQNWMNPIVKPRSSTPSSELLTGHGPVRFIYLKSSQPCTSISVSVLVSPVFRHSSVRFLKGSVHKNSLCISCLLILSYPSIPTPYISLPGQY